MQGLIEVGWLSCTALTGVWFGWRSCTASCGCYIPFDGERCCVLSAVISDEGCSVLRLNVILFRGID